MISISFATSRGRTSHVQKGFFRCFEHFPSVKRRRSGRRQEASGRVVGPIAEQHVHGSGTWHPVSACAI